MVMVSYGWLFSSKLQFLALPSHMISSFYGEYTLEDAESVFGSWHTDGRPDELATSTAGRGATVMNGDIGTWSRARCKRVRVL
jgi:hypothetical protein